MRSTTYGILHRVENWAFWFGLSLIMLATAFNVTVNHLPMISKGVIPASLIETYEDLGSLRVTLMIVSIGLTFAIYGIFVYLEEVRTARRVREQQQLEAAVGMSVEEYLEWRSRSGAEKRSQPASYIEDVNQYPWALPHSSDPSINLG